MIQLRDTAVAEHRRQRAERRGDSDSEEEDNEEAPVATTVGIHNCYMVIIGSLSIILFL